MRLLLIHITLRVLLEDPLSLNIGVLDSTLREPPREMDHQKPRETGRQDNSQFYLFLSVLN